MSALQARLLVSRLPSVVAPPSSMAAASSLRLAGKPVNCVLGTVQLRNLGSWASEVVQEVVGEDVDADDWAGFETPRELGRNIVKLEAKQPTTLGSPKPLKNNPASSLMKRKG